jgi:hypothetical protein
MISGYELTESEQAQTISFGFIGLISIDVMPHLLLISISSLQCAFKQLLFALKSNKRTVQSSKYLF